MKENKLSQWFNDFLKDCIQGQYGCADNCEGGKECKENLEQIKQLITLSGDKDWEQVKKDLGEFMKKQTPIPEDKLNEFVEKWTSMMSVAFYESNIMHSIKLLLKEYNGLMDSRVENLAYPFLPEVHDIPPKKEEK